MKIFTSSAIKRCEVLAGKDQKKLKSIEFTGTRKVMKKIPAKVLQNNDELNIAVFIN
jgi:hypothetical protein